MAKWALVALLARTLLKIAAALLVWIAVRKILHAEGSVRQGCNKIMSKWASRTFCATSLSIKFARLHTESATKRLAL